MRKADLDRRNRGLLPTAGVALVLAAMAAQHWGGPRLQALSVATVVAGLLLWILFILRGWRSRRPLQLRPYGELRYSDRPLAYHLCTFGVAFVLAMVALAMLVAAFGNASR